MPAIRICRNCGTEIKAYGPQILCSDKCRKEDRNKQERLRYASDVEYRKDKIARATKPIKQPRIIRCEWCGKPLETRTRRKYCNKICQDEYWKHERRSNPEVRDKKLASDKAAYEKRKSTSEGRDKLREQYRKANSNPRTVARRSQYWRERKAEDPRVRESFAAASRSFGRRFKEKHGISTTAFRRRANSNYRIATNLRSRLRAYLRIIQAPKADKTTNLIGLNPKPLQEWIESQFEPGMNWSNYATDGWHIDHTRPLSSFDLTDERQQYVASNWRNLRPMWGPGEYGNLSKQKRYTAQDQEEWVNRMKWLGWEGELYLKDFLSGNKRG